MAYVPDTLTSTDTDTLAGRHVLVVDDDPCLRYHACDVLGKLGFKVTEAADGQQAIALAGDNRFDLILLDVRMPGLDGFETCRALRRGQADPELPIVMVTGLEDIGAITRAYRAGATDFAVKPVNWPVLTNRIAWLLRNRLMARHLGLDAASRQLHLGVGRDSILQLDAEGRVEAARLATDGITGLDFAIQVPLLDGLPEQARDRAAAALTALRNGSASERFRFVVEASDVTHHVEAVLAASGGEGVFVLLRDVTEHVMAERQMHRLAFYDSLTGLANLDMLRRHLADRQAADTLVGVVRLELDGLQSMRAVLGMDRVDDVFRRCGQCLAEWVGSLAPGDNVYGEVLLGRASETGFAVVMSGFDGAQQLEAFAQRLGGALLSQCAEQSDEVALDLRIGTALHRPDDADDGDLLANAELAMRDGPAGVDQVARYTPATRSHTLERLGMVADLKQALDNGALHLVYQPKFAVDGGKLVGVEALLRWDRPGHGPVSPGCFIPLAEETGLILPLGDYVIEQACRQARQWRTQDGGGLPVAVNMSRIQLNQRGLVARIADCMQANALDQCGLEIELTESVAMQESGQVRRILAEMQELGIRTAIDDFGTGHSSLGNLRDFHFNTLKVDRSFIKDIDHGPGTRAILEAIVAMGHALDMEVVAEGVEETHQLDFLRGCGCDVVQGFLTGRPQPAEDITSLLAGRCGEAGVELTA